MAKRKNLKAYVRLDSSRKPIPGSLVYRQDKPYGRFSPMVNPYGDVCCAPETVCGTPYAEYTEVFTGSCSGAYSITDSECNNYFLFYKDPGLSEVPVGYTASAILEKRDKDGVFLWSKQLNTEGVINTGLYQLLLDETNGRIYIGGYNSVTALDLAGNPLWFKKFAAEDTPYSNAYFATFSLSPDKNFIYIGVTLTGLENSMFKLSSFTGALIKSVKAEPLLANPNSFERPIYGSVTDKAGNTFFAVRCWDYPTFSQPAAQLLKMDPDLNLLFPISLGVAGYTNSWDTPSVDYDGNIIMYNRVDGAPGLLGVSGALKLSGATGAPIWRAVTYNTSWSPGLWNLWDFRIGNDNSIYAVALDQYTYSSFQVFKITSSGSLEYVNRIQASSNNVNTYYYNSATMGGNPTKGFLFVVGWSYGQAPISYYNIKTPLSLVEGTYGPFVFTNTTSDFTWQKDVPTYDAPTNWTILDNTLTISPLWLDFNIATVSVPDISIIQPL